MFFQSIKQNLCAHYPGLQAKRDLEMIYKSIAERLRIRLNSADFTLNSLLPGEKKLAEEFAVSRMTIRKAIDLLVAWGLVVRRHGSGTYPVRKDVLHQTASLTGLVEVLKRQGKRSPARC